MAFAFTLYTEPFDTDGKFRCVRGSYTNTGGSTGGDIVTGLNQVWEMLLQPTGGALSSAVVNETFPLMSGTVTIITVANASGTFRAVGR